MTANVILTSVVVVYRTPYLWPFCRIIMGPETIEVFGRGGEA